MGSLGICLSVLFGFVLLTWNYSTVFIETNAMPPPSSLKCDRYGCTLYNAYGVWDDRKDCQVRRVVYPETEEELLLAVAEANKKKLKVKIVTGFSHSIPKLACPLRILQYLQNMTVTVDSGVGLRNLIDKVEDAGLSLVVSPYWEGLSIGGIVSTGAHGSSWWGKGGAVHDHIVGISVIVAANVSDGYAKIIQLDAQNPLFNAARVSLGMLTNGLKNDRVSITGYLVVGRQGRMQASGSCLYSPKLTQSTCVWDRRIKGLFFYESGAVFPASNFGDFIRDVEKLRDIKPSNFCGLYMYIGFLMRFLKSFEAYLGHSKDFIAVDFTYYRANDPLTPRMNQDIWEEIEQMALFKYRAKPHWAKNRILAFFGVKEKYPKFNKFLEAKKPLVITESANVEGCAMEGQCICSVDKHCNPRLGYLCQPGLVYTEAKVCRPSF
ncbi:hypothetical protein MKX03_017562 [Papaver bracteatum]|nr:hypothetical protein MKX03_017562 [Papaver bracteatum]